MIEEKTDQPKPLGRLTRPTRLVTAPLSPLGARHEDIVRWYDDFDRDLASTSHDASCALYDAASSIEQDEDAADKDYERRMRRLGSNSEQMGGRSRAQSR